LGLYTVATGLAGDPTAPGKRSGGTVSRKRLRWSSGPNSPQLEFGGRWRHRLFFILYVSFVKKKNKNT